MKVFARLSIILTKIENYKREFPGATVDSLSALEFLNILNFSDLQWLKENCRINKRDADNSIDIQLIEFNNSSILINVSRKAITSSELSLRELKSQSSQVTNSLKKNYILEIRYKSEFSALVDKGMLTLAMPLISTSVAFKIIDFFAQKSLVRVRYQENESKDLRWQYNIIDVDIVGALTDMFEFCLNMKQTEVVTCNWHKRKQQP